MIQSGQYHIVADQSAVVNCNAALILKFTAHVDENPFADRNVFSAVGIKGGKRPKVSSTSFPMMREKISRTSSGVW